MRHWAAGKRSHNRLRKATPTTPVPIVIAELKRLLKVHPYQLSSEPPRATAVRDLETTREETGPGPRPLIGRSRERF